MILSHSKKFIYIKGIKVAGSSMEATLWKSCTPKDMRTPMDLKNEDERFGGHNHPKDRTVVNHSRPDAIRKYVGTKVWNDYHKIVCVRNPWDAVVSLFWFRQHKEPTVVQEVKEWDRQKALPSFLEWFNSPKRNVFPYENREFLYWPDGSDTADTYLRVEHLDEDYLALCEKLDIRPVKIGKFKSTQRKNKEIHYSHYYDKCSMLAVAMRCGWEQARFGYRFEGEHDRWRID